MSVTKREDRLAIVCKMCKHAQSVHDQGVQDDL